MSKNPIVIGVSWLKSLDYCEYKFYLHKVKGIGLQITKKIQEGTQIHEHKEKEFLKEAKPTSWIEFLQSEELTITKEIDFDKQIGDIILLGKIDEIAVDKEKIQIIDDKPRAFPYLGSKLQIYAYCYLFNEKFKEQPKPIFATLRDRDTNEVTWQQRYSKNEENEFFQVFHRMRSILLQNEDPIPTKNPNKCRACQFKDSCEYSLAKSI